MKPRVTARIQESNQRGGSSRSAGPPHALGADQIRATRPANAGARRAGRHWRKARTFTGRDLAPLGSETACAPVACRTDMASNSPSVMTTLVASAGTVCMPNSPRSPPAGCIVCPRSQRAGEGEGGGAICVTTPGRYQCGAGSEAQSSPQHPTQAPQVIFGLLYEGVKQAILDATVQER